MGMHAEWDSATPALPGNAVTHPDLPMVIDQLHQAIARCAITYRSNPGGERDNTGYRHTEHLATAALVSTARNAVTAFLASLSTEDTCVVGDPDPTPVRLDDNDCCGAQAPTRSTFVCTRWRDHAGRQHVAGTGTRVAHVWPWQSQ